MNDATELQDELMLTASAHAHGLDPGRVAGAREYLSALFAEPVDGGKVLLPTGSKPFVNDSGKVRHHRWNEDPRFAAGIAEFRHSSHPEMLDDLALAIVQAADDGSDVYVCPYRHPVGRRKGGAVDRRRVHADVDGPLDLAAVRGLDGFAVGSGTAHNGHAYLELTAEVTVDEHEALCRAFARRVGGAYADLAKCSDNDVLRPPGSLNHKPRVRGEGPPAPVVWLIRPTQRKWDPAALAEELGIVEWPPVPSPPTGADGAGRAAVIDADDLPEYVRTALEQVSGDRSADTACVVGACVRAGLDRDQTEEVVRLRDDLAGRLDERRDDDIGRLHGKFAANDTFQIDNTTGQTMQGTAVEDQTTVGPAVCRQAGDPAHASRQCVVCRERELWVTEEGEQRVRNRKLERLQLAVSTGLDSHALARLPLYPSSEVAARESLPDNLPGILGPGGTVTELTGYRGSGKSLFAHGLAQAVAHGFTEYVGLPLRLSGSVIYVAREGVPGWPRRVRAWVAHHGQRVGDGMQFIHDPIDITKPEDLAALAAIIAHTRAVMLVLDPVSMTGGHREDEENYQEYRAAALGLAMTHSINVVLLTNTGHAVRTRGRNSSMLVDGMDVSIALVKDEKTGIVEPVSNKERDMGKIGDLRMKFVGAGEIDPDTGKHLSGVLVQLTQEDKEELAREELARQMDELNKSLKLAKTAVLPRCSCSQTATGGGCEKGGATTAEVAAALGIDPADRERSKRVREALRPAVEHGYVRSIGKTQGLRWHYGRGEEARQL